MSTQALVTNWGKVIDQRDANPCKVSYALERKRESEGYGFKSQRQQRIFLPKSMLRLNLYNHLVMEFVHYVSVS